MITRVDLRGLFLQELEQLAQELGEAPYRGRQLFNWVHRRRALSFEAMTNLPRVFKEKLVQAAELPDVKIKKRLVSGDGLTTKLLIELPDGAKVECVFMSYTVGRRRHTACLSSQVGCALGCSFCATGRTGFQRNLTAGEIILQAVALAGELGSSSDRISNVVFMGMGEPLLNYDAVMKAVRIFEEPEGWEISHRRITISTCGLVPQIERLSGEKPPPELAVSLHAATNGLREKLMPVNRRYPLEVLIPACRRYAEITGRKVAFEYALIAGVNDSREDARCLGKLLKGILSYVNLIPLNPIKSKEMKGVSKKKAQVFAAWLKNEGLEVAVRESRGRDISAACGQLRGTIEEV